MPVPTTKAKAGPHSWASISGWSNSSVVPLRDRFLPAKQSQMLLQFLPEAFVTMGLAVEDMQSISLVIGHSVLQQAKVRVPNASLQLLPEAGAQRTL